MLLIDSRFALPDYRRLMPPHWSGPRLCRYPRPARRDAGRFLEGRKQCRCRRLNAPVHLQIMKPGKAPPRLRRRLPVLYGKRSTRTSRRFHACWVAQIGRGRAVRHGGAERRHKDEPPDQEDHPDRDDADQVAQRGGMVPGSIERANGVQQHLQRAARLCLASILINSMPMTRLNAWPRNVRKASVLLLVTSGTFSPADRHHADQQRTQHSTESKTSKMLDTAATWLRSIWVRRRSRAYRCRRRLKTAGGRWGTWRSSFRRGVGRLFSIITGKIPQVNALPAPRPRKSSAKPFGSQNGRPTPGRAGRYVFT